ncbi:hypothetical protein [Microbulbifer sp.]|uniref:hypothetical protein n=1 Tax=Microbulbifer sp. TaxID=1908541 RepID=UPI002F939206
MQLFSSGRRFSGFALISLLISSACLAGNEIIDLRVRYQLQRADISKNALGLPSGHFNLRGDLTEPASAPVSGFVTGGAYSSVDALARAFVAGNMAMFDISDPDTELQLQSGQEDRFGTRHLRYRRLVSGLPLADMELIFHVDRDGQVRGANGSIVRLTEGLKAYLADFSSSPRRSEASVVRTIAADLGVAASTLHLVSAELTAHQDAPHVRWQVQVQVGKGISLLSYSLDDADGAIIKRDDLIQRRQFGEAAR